MTTARYFAGNGSCLLQIVSSPPFFETILQMLKNHFWFAVAAPVVLLVSLAIRLSGHAETARSEVSGFVFLDNAPLTNAEIFLVCENSSGSNSSYFGHSNDGGHYEIVNGVPPGNYRVIVKRLMSNVQDASEPHHAVDDIDPGQMQAMLAARHDREQRSGSRSHRSTRTESTQQLPDEYSRVEQTVLRLSVPEGGLQTADLYLSMQTQQTAQRPSPPRIRQ